MNVRAVRPPVVLGVALALAGALACDRGPASGAAKRDENAAAPAAPSAQVPSSAAGPPSTEPSPAAKDAAPAEPGPPSSDPPDESAADPIGRLAAAAEASEDPSAAAWTHYEAKDYAQAQRYFAQATLAEAVPWKHPFNLACAAALAGDEQVARVALTEAVSRDRDATAKKARRDADLASLRARPWFEAVLRGEGAEPPGPAEPGGDVAPAAPEPGSGVALTQAQLAELRAQLEAKHGLEPMIRASFSITEAGGEPLAWALYEFRRVDVCALSSTQAACAKKFAHEPDEYDDSVCTEQRMVRARLGAKLQLDEPVSLSVPCAITKIRSFEATDVDGDGHAEVFVDLIGSRTAEIGMHEDPHTQSGRAVQIARLDGSTQFELAFDWTIMGFAFGVEHANDFRLIDQNGDGHPDLEVREVEFDGTDMIAFNEVLWPNLDEEGVGPATATLRVYSPSTDEWGAPVPTDARNP